MTTKPGLYEIHGESRKVSAIGIFEPFTLWQPATDEAAAREAAANRLYGAMREHVLIKSVYYRGLITIGDVSTCEGEPPDGNIYKASGDIGPERAEALRAFRDGAPTTVTYWYAPSSGGACRIIEPAVIDWRGLSS